MAVLEMNNAAIHSEFFEHDLRHDEDVRTEKPLEIISLPQKSTPEMLTPELYLGT
jgi:hypothetical protein